MLPPFPPGIALTIEIVPYLLPGTIVVWEGRLLTRHMSEFLLGASGASWHPNGGVCPTWTGECLCMVEGC